MEKENHHGTSAHCRDRKELETRILHSVRYLKFLSSLSKRGSRNRSRRERVGGRIILVYGSLKYQAASLAQNPIIRKANT